MFLLPKSGGGKATCPCQIQGAGYQLILLFTVHTAKQPLVFGSEVEFIRGVQDKAACFFSSEAFGCWLICKLQSAAPLSTCMFWDASKREGYRRPCFEEGNLSFWTSCVGVRVPMH